MFNSSLHLVVHVCILVSEYPMNDFDWTDPSGLPRALPVSLLFCGGASKILQNTGRMSMRPAGLVVPPKKGAMTNGVVQSFRGTRGAA